MAAELARDNAGELRGVLGREPEPAELYLAHFLGAGGARSFLTALHADPGQSAAALLPQAAGANRAIFFDNGQARSVGEVMELMRGKVSSAMEGGASGWSQPSVSAEFQVAASRPLGPPPAESAIRRPSMAETLQSTFGAGAQLAGPGSERVGKAYAAFKAFDL